MNKPTTMKELGKIAGSVRRQLVADYGFEVIVLVDFFSWEKSDMALHYSRRGA
jgi:hypothetical protein